MQRREFLKSGLGAAGAGLVGARAAAASQDGAAGAAKPFRLKYAPHFGMFRHHAKDLVDQVKFMHEAGFRALEDNGMRNRPVELQGKIAAEMERLGMEMGVFVAYAEFRKVTFASDSKADTDDIVKQMKRAVEVAKRVNARWCTVVPGRYSQGLEWDYQTARVVENLKRAAEVCEPAGLTMVLEPLNWWANHAGVFLHKIPQAYLICRSVGSPSVKILFDIYHQQITEGNLIPNMNRSWDEVAYLQIGDNPGRKEPTTGEINYKNVFKHVHAKGFEGILGMEHGNSQRGIEGEKRVIAAYRECDSF